MYMYMYIYIYIYIYVYIYIYNILSEVCTQVSKETWHTRKET